MSLVTSETDKSPRGEQPGPRLRVQDQGHSRGVPCGGHSVAARHRRSHTGRWAQSQARTRRQKAASTPPRASQATRPRPVPAPQGDGWLVTRRPLGWRSGRPGLGSWWALRTWAQGHSCTLSVGVSPLMQSVCASRLDASEAAGRAPPGTRQTPHPSPDSWAGAAETPQIRGLEDQKQCLHGVRWVGEGPVPRGPSESGSPKVLGAGTREQAVASPHTQASPASRRGGLHAS